VEEIRKRVCVLTPRFPYPVIGGDRLRIYEICKELSKTCSVTLLSLCESKEEMDFSIPDDGVFENVSRVYLPKIKSFANVISAFFNKSSLQVAYYKSDEFSTLVDNELAKHDVFIPHLIRMADYLIDKPVPKILEMTDAISLNYSRFRTGNITSYFNIKSLVYKFEYSRLARYERKCIESFDYVSLVSSVDREYLIGALDFDHIFVCSNGVCLDQFPVYEICKLKKYIAFVGNMHSVQNLDAVWYFAKNILPLLRKRGDFFFKIIGRIHDVDASRLGMIDGVFVRSNVENVSDELAGVFAAVAPIRLGAGVQNKVLEYMASGIPTVVSKLAAEGLSAVDGEDFLIAKNNEEFVELLGMICEDEDLASRLAQSGRAYVEKFHAWSSQLEKFVSVVHELGNSNNEKLIR